MPIYLKLMGTESFGLIGFFLTLQAWLQLFDLGLSPTFSREMSLFKAGEITAANAWRRLRSLEWLLGLLVLTSTSMLILFRNLIATYWLNVKHLSINEVSLCIILMTITAGLRWLTGLYRSGLVGLERQVLINSAGVFFVTFKFVGILPLLTYWSVSPVIFFGYQTFIGISELAFFIQALYRELPGTPSSPLPSLSSLKAIFPVAGAMAFMSGMWIFVTQLDKLILSKQLSLEDYGYFTIAVMLAGGLLVLIVPLNQVLQPRMTILASQGKTKLLYGLYRQATQLITASFIAIGGTLALFAKPILIAWTGNITTAQAAAPILFWYGLANALISILVLPFMLQFAYGYLRLHVVGNIVLLITLLPLLVYTSTNYGAIGAGITLLTAHSLFLFLWVPLVHRKLLPDLVWRWPIFDVGKVAFAVLIFLLIVRSMLPQIENRLSIVFIIGLVLLGSLTVGLLAGDRSRQCLINIMEGQ